MSCCEGLSVIIYDLNGLRVSITYSENFTVPQLPEHLERKAFECATTSETSRGGGGT